MDDFHPSDESVFAILRSDLQKRHIMYTVQFTVQAIQYGVSMRGWPCHSDDESSENDRNNLKALIQNLVEAFGRHRQMAMVIVALIYIERAKKKFKQTNICCAVFVSALMLATKFTGERDISNRAWKRYAGIKNQAALDGAERALLNALDYDLSITDAQMLYHIHAMQLFDKPWANGTFPSARFSRSGSSLDEEGE